MKNHTLEQVIAKVLYTESTDEKTVIFQTLPKSEGPAYGGDIQRWQFGYTDAFNSIKIRICLHDLPKKRKTDKPGDVPFNPFNVYAFIIDVAACCYSPVMQSAQMCKAVHQHILDLLYAIQKKEKSFPEWSENDYLALKEILRRL